MPTSSSSSRGANPLVADHQFILATRNTGYRSVAAALAELIDNSIQAGATTVRVFVNEERVENARGISIAVLDDGCGMDERTLVRALQFGGSDRFDDRSGLGRFGMGLPNSSVSQSRCLEVFTWQGASRCLHSYIDVDKIADRSMRAIPRPRYVDLPNWAQGWAAPHGTLVVWSRCDRVGFKKASTVVAKLQVGLGRIYRYALWNGLQVIVNGINVIPVDPLYISEPTADSRAVPYGPPLIYNLRLPESRVGKITVRFSELPVADWHRLPIEAKRKIGIVGGAGVSIVRAGREIDYGWHLMGGKRRENYDDWWRCEISFDPTLDELFGVTHSKQGITPSAELRNVLERDLEGVARSLNARVRTAFEKVRAHQSRATLVADRGETYLPPMMSDDRRFSKRSYAIEISPLAEREFYGVQMRDGNVVLTLNRDHPFFDKIYGSAGENSETRKQMELQCLLLAAARAEISFRGEPSEAWCLEFRRRWADALATFCDRL